VKAWVYLLVLLGVAVLGALGWQALALDPGALVIRYGQTRIETTLVFALFALVVAWIVLGLLWRLLRWPVHAWRARGQRRGRERFAKGLTALAEGDHKRALRALEGATQHAELQGPALLATARAAHARGDTERTDAALDQAAAAAPAAALALRARFLLEHGNAEAALALLQPAADKNELPPIGWRLLAEAALLCGDHALAQRAVDRLARSDALAPEALTSLRARVLAAVLGAAPDSDTLESLWSDLPRPQRAMPEAITAYARRAAQFGRMLAAMDVLDGALRRQWSEHLVRAWGELGPADAQERLRRAEGWLDAHPSSPGLLLTLGRLCIQCELWGKAREYAERGLALAPSAALWETLGDSLAAGKTPADVAICYQNAVRCARGDPTRALAERSRAPLDTRASIGEERTEHGMPRLSVATEMDSRERK
jgi:HemY protein